MANNLFWRQINNKIPHLYLIYNRMNNLETLTFNELTEFADKYFAEKGYFLPQGEWDTMATQLCSACCKIVYRWWNDWDQYDKRSGAYDVWTQANWIHNRVFKLKRFNDYEANLRYLIIKTLEVIDSLADKPAEWSIYTEEWTRFRKN